MLQFKYRVLMGLVAFLATVTLAVVSGDVTPGVAAPSESVENSACGAVSCTIYLPLVMHDFPPPIPLEVTQATQQPDNSVPLITGRPTFVRATITSTVAHANVNAKLYGTRNGVSLPGSPLAALNTPRTLKATADRQVLGDTFNFQLPAAWASGTIEISVVASNTLTYTLQSGAKDFQFTSVNPMNVTIVPIRYSCNSGGSGTTLPASPYGYVTDYTFRIYPVASIVTTTHTAVDYSGPCNSNGLPNPSSSDWSNMLYRVTDVWESEGGPDSYYYGLLRICCSGIVGIGWIGSPIAIGYDANGGLAASQTHAHEVGHNHGRYHAPGCGAAHPDPYYPYKVNVSGDVRGVIGDSAHLNYGFDIKTQAIYTHTKYYDIMGYCGPKWVSDYSYRAFLDWDLSRTMGAPVIAANGPTLFVSGRIDLVTGNVTLSPAYVLDTPSRLPKPGEYTLELLNAQGNSVGAYDFAPLSAEADALDPDTSLTVAGFSMSLPYVKGVAALRVRRGETVLGTLQAGADAPALIRGTQLFNTNTHSTRVTWWSDDAEGDALHYLVRASTDGGATWQTIGVNLSTPYIDLDPQDFLGQRVLLDVLASDGLHTTSLRMGPFEVPAVSTVP